MIKKCLNCKKKFKTYPSRVGKFCSQSCNSSITSNGFKKGHKIGIGNTYCLGHKLTEKHKLAISKKVKGHPNYLLKHSDETRKKISLKMGGTGESTYEALHDWVRRWKGEPKKCESCNTKSAKRFEWANIDHKYQWILDDYIRMCTSCHRKFDYLNKKLT